MHMRHCLIPKSARYMISMVKKGWSGKKEVRTLVEVSIMMIFSINSSEVVADVEGANSISSLTSVMVEVTTDIIINNSSKKRTYLRTQML